MGKIRFIKRLSRFYLKKKYCKVIQAVPRLLREDKINSIKCKEHCINYENTALESRKNEIRRV